jgi:hypothetical protein
MALLTLGSCRKFLIATLIGISTGIALLNKSEAQGPTYAVYSTYRPIDLGFPGEVTPRDYFVNMGSNQGVKPGSFLRVLRKAPTYDVSNQKIYRDVIFPIARLKVIHVESNAAIARLDEYAPTEATPAFSPRVVMVGDQVELSR